MRSLLILLLLYCNNTFSQSAKTELTQPNYRFSHISVADGLAPGAVNCIFKESRGFLWVGTSSGLSRYDGYKIKNYRPDPKNDSAYQSSGYKGIFEDPLGNIWLQTTLGINIFNPITEKFSSDQFSILQQLNIPAIEVKDIVKDHKGNFWFIHSNASLSKYNPTLQKVNHLDLTIEGFNKQDLDITYFAENSEGDFWIIFSNGMLQKLKAKSLEVSYSTTVLNQKFPGKQHDYQLVIDNYDNLWIHLYEDFGLYYYNVSSNKLKNYNTQTSSIRLSSNLINDFVKDNKGKIWVGTDHGGIDIIDPDNFSVDYVSNNPEIRSSLSQNSITSFYRDRDGIIWIGTFKNGLDYYHPSLIKFPLEKKLLSSPESLPFNDVNVFTEDEKGNIFIGTNGGGLLYFNRKKGTYTQYQHDPDDASSISSNVIVSLLYDSKGTLWVGTYLGGLNKMTSDGFKSFKHIPSDTTSIGGNNVWELLEDSRGNMWVGTLSAGLYKFDRSTEKFFQVNEKGERFAPNITYVSAIDEDDENNIWVGGVNGIDVILSNGKLLHFSYDADKKASLSSNYIRSIYKDHFNNIWIGTDEGLDLYDRQNQSFYHYNQQDGLPGKRVVAITSDNQYDIWLTSSYGLSQLKIDSAGTFNKRITPNFKNYNYEDGLQGNLFNENAIFSTSKGELLVGGMDGYNIFNPQHFEYNSKEPKIIFTDFILFNSSLNPNEEVNGRVILNEPIQSTEEITLKYDENLFSVEFAALDFLQPSKNKYRYKLEGFDQQWRSTTSDLRKVTYTNLDPGNYKLRVQAANNDGVWNKEGAELKIVVLPPFYKTTLAYISYAILLILILYFSRRNIIQKQHKNFQIEQEKREAAYLHKMDLMKISFFTNINHEFKTPISLILASIEKLRTYDLREQSKEQINSIHKSAQKLLRLINQILDLGNIKNESLLFESAGNIIDFTQQIVDSFKDLAENRGVRIEFNSQIEAFHSHFDKDKLDKILFNLLSNAVKFTPKGGLVKVEVKIKKDSGLEGKQKLFDLKISDTGIGIPESDRSKIFERFFKAEQPAHLENQGSGVGLALVKEYIELFQGKISVKSALGEGTLFHISFPVKPAHTPNQPTSLIVKKELKTINNELLPSLLIIEDDMSFLNHLIPYFKNEYNVFIAADGEEGWKKTLSVRPDIIICDWQIPKITGIELCDKLREDSRTKHIPFILITANDLETSKLKALKSGVSDYITKPFNFEELQSRVQNLITQQQLFKKTYSKKIEVTPVENKVTFESEDEKLMRKVLQIIKSNVNDPNFSVDHLAKEAGVSRSFLYNKTLTLFQKPPLQLITDTRLEEGKELLTKTQLTISEIAFKVGFNNPKYFTRNFKKKYNALPSSYRTEANSKN
ncbi:hybrid sensor histidine kinase/response regulator [Marivirga lumbricoides]|uniref:histidine kinase n=1 Tax=Marivirga lumbricoides TaxID=1046115 RepID=A0ABQ1L616_9BACT|nr:hybrid sensor histidine kinase/response regulator [Marivirga lumbricoides]